MRGIRNVAGAIQRVIDAPVSLLSFYSQCEMDVVSQLTTEHPNDLSQITRRGELLGIDHPALPRPFYSYTLSLRCLRFER